VVTDRDACPDIATFTDGLDTTLTELAPALAGRAVNSSRTAG
jgi:hypothetical protein